MISFELPPSFPTFVWRAGFGLLQWGENLPGVWKDGDSHVGKESAAN